MHMVGNRDNSAQVKKYIAEPTPFDGQLKNWSTFKSQINTYIQANVIALARDEDRNWFVLSLLKEGPALQYAQMILRDVDRNIRAHTHTQFMSALEGIFGDPSE